MGSSSRGFGVWVIGGLCVVSRFLVHFFFGFGDGVFGAGASWAEAFFPLGVVVDVGWRWVDVVDVGDRGPVVEDCFCFGAVGDCYEAEDPSFVGFV